MATLIGLALLAWLMYLAVRDGRRAFGRPRSANPVLRRLDAETDPDRLDLDRLRRDMAAAYAVDLVEDDQPADTSATADTVAEQRETTLTQQLLAGTLEPAVYQRLMCELAHDSTRSGGAR